MHTNRIAAIIVSIVLFGLLAPSSPEAQVRGSSDILFTVSMPRPWTHLLEVELQMRVPANLNVPNETDLIMPVWTPGSYLIREFERNVQDFAATDLRGAKLEWTKINKDTWRVKTGDARQWRVFYRVYADELTVRTHGLNSDHGFWNNAALLMYPDGRISSPATLRV